MDLDPEAALKTLGRHHRRMGEQAMTYGEREEVDLSKKVRYAESVYGVEGLLGVKCWNAGECFITIVAIMGGCNDWAAYVGALPNRRLARKDGEPADPEEVLLTLNGELGAEFEVAVTTEEEVVRYTVSKGGKMLAKDAAALFGLPERQYRR